MAARDTAGRLCLALVNVDPEHPARFDVELPGPTRGAVGQLLTASKVDGHNDFDHPHAVEPRPVAGQATGRRLRFELPPKSIAVVMVG